MKITVTPQGPYVVSNLPVRRAYQQTTAEDEPLAWGQGSPVDTASEVADDGTVALCRCGGSSNKPFCDGTHRTRQWDGNELAPTDTYDDRAEVLGGCGGVQVRDDRSICEGAGFCGTRTTDIWKILEGGTATSDQMQQVTGMVDKCPSGALTYRREDGRPLGTHADPSINVVADGPLWVTGAPEVERADGQPFESRERMTLCRCGASATKPLCDGSHTKIGWKDS